MSKKPVVLMILDGYGLNGRTEGNAVAQAKTPVMDRLMAEYPFVRGDASGMAVGLPDGQMGNSEVGHLNMGAGRIVYQELTRITKEIQDGTFLKIRRCWMQSITVRSMAVRFTCSVCCLTVEYTATIPICMVFWNWQREMAWKKYMYTASWTEGIHRLPAERDMPRRWRQRCRKSVWVRSLL